MLNEGYRIRLKDPTPSTGSEVRASGSFQLIMPPGGRVCVNQTGKPHLDAFETNVLRAFEKMEIPVQARKLPTRVIGMEPTTCVER